MDQVIRFGFEEIKIKDDYGIHPQFLKKGKVLYDSECVHKVEELKFPAEKFSIVRGYVERQTNKSLPVYKVELNVDVSRFLTSAKCDCAAGESGICKHVSALIHRINQDSGKSKTSVAREWGIPNVSKAVEEKYSKGKEIEDLIVKNRREVKRKAKIRAKQINHVQKKSYQPIILNLNMFSNIPSSLQLTLEAEKKTEEEKALELNQRSDAEIERQLKIERRLNYIIDIIYSQNAVKISAGCAFQDLLHAIVYTEHIVLDKETIKRICKETVLQANCEGWFKVRDDRLSATKSHKIKTRRKAIDEAFLDSLISRIELRGKALENVKYGRENENVALERFKSIYQQKYGLDVHKVGVVVSIEQPWLCGSPDAVVMTSSGLRVLEIKCPSSCRELPIVEEDGTLNVDYLEHRDGRVQLKKSSQYYTQCQILMYLTNANLTYFYVYSKVKPLLTLVARDESFLNLTVIKLERFYFEHYLPRLCAIKFKNMK